MSHEDAYLPGSIDGVPFFSDSWQTTPGRDTKVHRFYGRDLPWVEDKGKGIYRLNGNIFLAGDDYHLQRDRLREVLDSPGPYRLVDPFRGPVTVRLETQPTFLEERTRRGMVRVATLALVQTSPDEPTIYVTGKGKVVDLASVALDALAENTTFSLRSLVPGQRPPGTFANDIIVGRLVAGLRSATRAIARINARVSGMLGQPSQLALAIDAFDRQINDLINTPSQLMGNLTGLVRSVMQVVKTFEALVPSLDVEVPEFPVVEAGSAAIRDAVSFETAPAETPEPEDVQGGIELRGQTEITLQVNAAAVIAGADMATELDFKSGDQAVAMADLLTDGFDLVLGNPTLPPETYEAIAAVRSEAIRYLLRQAARLPQIETIVLPQQLHAIVLAYSLYGDPTRALEIGRRNDIDDIGALPSGVSLEVISDA